MIGGYRQEEDIGEDGPAQPQSNIQPGEDEVVDYEACRAQSTSLKVENVINSAMRDAKKQYETQGNDEFRLLIDRASGGEEVQQKQKSSNKEKGGFRHDVMIGQQGELHCSLKTQKAIAKPYRAIK